MNNPNLPDILVHRGLSALQTKDLCDILGVTRQRIYQMCRPERDNHVPKAHVEALDDANAAADLVAEFQVRAYRSYGAVSETDIETKYGELVMRCIEAFRVMQVDQTFGESLSESMGKGIEEYLSLMERQRKWKNSLSGYDWYMRAYETGLGVPPLPRIGKRHGGGFFALYNIGLERAAERIKAIGGMPRIAYGPASQFDHHAEHDARMWSIMGGGEADDSVESLRWFDAVKPDEQTWRWEFEPALVGNVLNDRLFRET